MSDNMNKTEEALKTAKQLEMLRKKYKDANLSEAEKKQINKAIGMLEKKFAELTAHMDAAPAPSAPSSAPVFYTADGRPVVPVYLPVDANGNPIVGFPGFNAPTAEPEEEYEELPDGTKMKIIYQDAAFKQEAEENKSKKKEKKSAEDYFSSMKVVYESPESLDNDAEEEVKPEEAADTQNSAPEEIPEEPAAAEEAPSQDVEEVKSSSLADLMNDAEQDKGKKKKSSENKESFGKRFMRNNIPMKGDPAGEIVRKIVMIIAVITLLCCLGYFVNLGVDEIKNRMNTSDLSGQLTPVNGDMDEFWADMRRKYPNTVFPEGINPRFADLYARNSDLVGWLQIDGTKIDFPIVQSKDNEYYLHRSFDKQETKYGNPFMDYQNKMLPLNRNTVLYGHHMRTGNQVFTDLTKYRDVEFFKKNPTIQFSTLYADYTWKIYGVFVTNSRPSDDNGYVLNYVFKDLNSDEDFMEYIKAVDERKLYTTGVDIKPTDKILTLSTCEYDWNEARLVVIARLTRNGEDKGVDVSKAAVNPNPRYPQAYYSKKGIENPYKNAKRWTP